MNWKKYGINYWITAIHNYAMQTYGSNYYQIQSQLNLLEYDYEITDKAVVKFTDNKYKGFNIKSKYSIEDISIYANQYMVFSGGYQYVLSIGSYDKSYFDSTEAKNIVDSFTIRNFNPIDTSPLMSFSNVLPIIAIIVVVIFAILYIIKKREDKKSTNRFRINKAIF